MTLARIRQQSSGTVETRSGISANWPSGWGWADPSAIPPPGMYQMQRAGVPVTIHALDTETPILTTLGWSTMGELKVGHEVYAEDGTPTRVQFVSEVFIDKQCFEVEFADGSKIVASADHKWKVWDALAGGLTIRSGNAWKVVTTSELAESYVRINSTSGAQVFRYRVSCDAVVDIAQSYLPVDPYLFGYWLGDGNSDSANLTVGFEDHDALVSAINDSDCEIISQLEVKSEWGDGYRIRFGNGASKGDGVESRLRNLGVMSRDKRSSNYDSSVEKHIPECYLLASKVQRRALLAGLLDSDGSVSDQPRVVFSNKSERLATDVFYLVRSLGIRATICCGADEMYTVSWTPTDNPFRLERKSHKCLAALKDSNRTSERMSIVAVREVESRSTRCIAVEHESHVFLVGYTFVPTHNTSLQIDSVFTACRVLTNSIIKMGNLRGYTKQLDKNNTPYKVWMTANPPLLENTWVDATSEKMWQYDGMTRTIMSMALFGEAFWFIVLRDSRDNPSVLEVLHPAFIEVKKRKLADGTTQKYYLYGSGVHKTELSTDEVVHIPFMALPGAERGLNTIQYGGVAFSLALAAMEYGSRWFAQGASPSFLLSTEQKLGREEVERIADKFLIEHSGLGSAHLPLVVDSGMKVEKISSTPDEAQYLNTLQYSRMVIAAWFGLPSHLVGGTADKGNVWGKTVQEQAIQLIDFTLSGYITRIEEAMSFMLPTNQFAAFDTDKIQRASYADRAAYITAVRTATVMDPNEVRAEVLEMGPSSDPTGDQLQAPLASNAPPAGGGAGGPSAPGLVAAPGEDAAEAAGGGQSEDNGGDGV